MQIESDWGDWLPRAIEQADPDGVAVWYLGCNGFALKAADGTTVFIDPYLGLGRPPRTLRMIPVPFNPEDVTAADAVLATHEHMDHIHGETQGPIMASTGASLYAPDDSIERAIEDERWLDEYDVDEDQFVEVAEGDVVDVGGFTVNVEEANDPDATHPVTYVIEYEGRTFFHGGDSRPSDEFARIGEEYDIDLGVLAFGTEGNIEDKETGEAVRTRWYSDENRIVEAANDLRLDRLLPSHWDMWKGMTADPTVLHHHANSFEFPRTLEIAEIGDRVDL